MEESGDDCIVVAAVSFIPRSVLLLALVDIGANDGLSRSRCCGRSRSYAQTILEGDWYVDLVEGRLEVDREFMVIEKCKWKCGRR